LSVLRLYAVYAVRLVVSASSHTAAAGRIIVAIQPVYGPARAAG